MSVLDRHFEQYHVNEVQTRELPLSPEDALTRILALTAASDPIVRALFRIRGIRGGHLPLERFATDVLHLEVVERTATSVAAVGGSPLRLGISFEAEARPGGCRLVTETRVAAADQRTLLAFHVYWFVVKPFSALIRRRWLRSLARGQLR
jgi:hypothetical protein